jgi:glycine dehydrogenase subunit 1
MDVSNASLYEGPSALAAAAYLAKLTNGRPRLVISRGVHPHGRETLTTLCEGYGMMVTEVPLSDGVTDLAAWTDAIDDDVGAVFVAQPNFLGAVEDLAPLIAAAREHGALVVASADPLTLGILEAPGVLGVDVCVGEGQTLGNRLDFGGPSFGFFAARDEHVRRMPGRIAGETVDVDGRRGFVLTLQTREQHIRREKATSNICTAQALNALAGVVYLSWLGRRGLVELGELLVQRTAYARDALRTIDGVTPLHTQPVVREFALTLGLSDLASVRRVIARCAGEHVNPGYPLGIDYPEYPDGLLVAVTEQRSRADIDQLVDVLGRAVALERAGAQAPGASHDAGQGT